MKKYITPCIRVIDMTLDVDVMVTESFTDDVADVKEFKDDDLWGEEVSTSSSNANLWDKEW